MKKLDPVPKLSYEQAQGVPPEEAQRRVQRAYKIVFDLAYELYVKEEKEKRRRRRS